MEVDQDYLRTASARLSLEH